MTFTPTELYMMQALVVCFFAFVVVIYLFRLKAKYQKQAIDHVNCRFITEEGTGYSRLMPVEQGFVEMPPNEKKGKKGKTYHITDLGTYLSDYPEGWVPKFLQTKIKECIFDEASWEPRTHDSLKGDSELSPGKLYNIRNERFTEMGVALAQREAEMQKSLEQLQKFKMGNLYVVSIITICAVVGLGVYIYITLKDMMAILTLLRQAAGV